MKQGIRVLLTPTHILGTGEPWVGDVITYSDRLWANTRYLALKCGIRWQAITNGWGWMKQPIGYEITDKATLTRSTLCELN